MASARSRKRATSAVDAAAKAKKVKTDGDEDDVGTTAKGRKSGKKGTKKARSVTLPPFYLLPDKSHRKTAAERAQQDAAAPAPTHLTR